MLLKGNISIESVVDKQEIVPEFLDYLKQHGLIASIESPVQLRLDEYVCQLYHTNSVWRIGFEDNHPTAVKFLVNAFNEAVDLYLTTRGQTYERLHQHVEGN